MKMTKTLAALAAFGTALLGASAFADTIAERSNTVDTRSTVVRFDPQALADPVAVDALQRDLVRAATRVCRPRGLSGLAAMRERRACVRRSVDTAVQTASIPQLSVLHANLSDDAKYRSLRDLPDASVLRMVAEAGGQSGSAGTIYQPPR